MDDAAFGLTWAGKQASLEAAREPPTATLAPETADTWSSSARHAVVEGDNLEVLRVLQRAYRSQVDLVAIDPPYNTGRQFAYDDDWTEPVAAWLDRTGQQDAGQRTRARPDLRGRRHSLWLSMMWPRLALCQDLLADHGFLVVCIDDHEAHHLRVLLDELFGPEQFVADIVWQKAYTANMTARWVSRTHDHLLVYARHAPAARVGRLPRTAAQRGAFKNPDDDPRGPWKAENLSASRPYSKGRFPITTPSGRTVSPPAGRCWRCSLARYEEWLADGRIWFGRDGQGRPMLKKFLAEMDDALTPTTWWPSAECGSNKEASTELKALFDGEAVFDTPKPVRLLRRVLDLFCPRDGLVVDVFAGSGTTGHAVVEANAADGGDRRAVLVQRPTPTDDPRWPTLTRLCHQRVERAARAVDTAAPRYFQLAPASLSPWDPSPPSDAAGLAERLRDRQVAPERTDAAWLSEQLLALGVTLDQQVERRPDGSWWVPDLEVLVCRHDPDPQAVLELRPRGLALPDSAWTDPGVRLPAVKALTQLGCEVRFVP